jgi:hypothetical protein
MLVSANRFDIFLPAVIISNINNAASGEMK